jgi:hypothetical protein
MHRMFYSSLPRIWCVRYTCLAPKPEGERTRLTDIKTGVPPHRYLDGREKYTTNRISLCHMVTPSSKLCDKYAAIFSLEGNH